MFFDLSSCPAGWSELTQARGRVVVGLVSDGTLGSTVGSPLTDLEDRTHTHDVNPSSTATTSNGSHSHSIDPPSTTSSGSGAHTHEMTPPNTWQGTTPGIVDVAGLGHLHNILSDGFHSHDVNISSFTSGSGGNHSHTVNIPNTTSTAASTSDMIPYIQLLVCKKD
jgi:hypothetical protein